MAKAVDPYEALEAFMAKHRTQKEAAEALGISQPYLNDLIRKQRGFSDNMLEKLGLTTIVVKS